MKQPISQLQQERKPGRSFDDPSQPLGQGTIERSAPSDDRANEDFRSREAQADMPHNGVAERAKAIAVLRKLEELTADNNPTAFDEQSLLCAHNLAAGRVGLTFPEYQSLVRGDAELELLEAKVLDACRARFQT